MMKRSIKQDVILFWKTIRYNNNRLIDLKLVKVSFEAKQLTENVIMSIEQFPLGTQTEKLTIAANNIYTKLHKLVKASYHISKQPCKVSNGSMNKSLFSISVMHLLIIVLLLPRFSHIVVTWLINGFCQLSHLAD